MKVTPLSLPGVLCIEPRVFSDERGYFMETYNDARYRAAGVDAPFVQDNVSRSRRGVLRGLHFQHPYPQGKLVSVLEGEVFDVVVDVRAGSPTFGQWAAEHLSAANHRQLWVPAGFAHGFVTLSDRAVFVYKCTDYYHPEAERTVRFDDPRIGIDWPDVEVTIAPRDAAAPLLDEILPKSLPPFAG